MDDVSNLTLKFLKLATEMSALVNCLISAGAMTKEQFEEARKQAKQRTLEVVSEELARRE